MSERDGGRDFDPLVGNWSIQLRRLLRPLSGSDEWAELTGSSTAKNIWDGRGQMEEIKLSSKADGTHIGALALRIYDPRTHEWNLYWANSNNPVFGNPQKGKFVGGRGEFYSRERHQGREVVVRYVWTNLGTNSPRFEQSFSVDDGQTWEPNWVAIRIRRP